LGERCWPAGLLTWPAAAGLTCCCWPAGLTCCWP